jgi:hypothetical protein
MRVDASSVMIFRLDDSGHHFVLQAGVQVFRVLPHDHEVHTLKSCVDARQIPHRAQIRIQVQRLAEAHVHAREAGADRRGDRSFQRDLVPADGVDQLDGQRLAGALERPHARQVMLPLDRHAGRFQDANNRFGHFRSDAVARNEGDGVRHIRQSGDRVI